ncbi:MAG: cytochrome c biogenesis protein CcdA [Aurantimonas sp.]|jgi:cytochrome c-type biogenesis protein|uniref:cytochrome c biogenesis CcdA family protein n=1 Tax=Aurantimonas TaxID=182269 RepID=UPI0003F9E23F|nr:MULTISPECIES: cytochrome c biogenesis protein CcdA [Aurantimonas]MAY29145.1 cytochrome c biogenesis protein CcdA [Aurantimonas sp.]MBC6714606.1 cytochrome c biogenesis protein CcdA [Aurantimonas sp. DM33-3]MCC4298487.1 cytochrome c biogenesis protein CcdA [Aurantimonas coralicida]
MLDVGYGAALLAGLLSFVSPCVLPIVPPYLAYLAGLSFDQVRERGTEPAVARQIMLASLAFVAGFTTVFVALGATASLVGQVIAQWFDVLSVVAGIIIIIMGLHFLGVFRLSLLYREARVNVAQKPAGPLGAYVIGLAFAFGWTPCVGPVLAAILFVAGSQDTALRGAGLLATYSIGIGVPFLLAAAFATRFLAFAARMRRHMATVEKIMGGALVFTGILFVTGQMATISYWLLETFPVFATIG